MTKAGSKAAKRRGRGGRPRKVEAERYPGGQIKHDWREQESEKEAKGTVIEMRQRIHGITGKDAGSPFAGYVLGRMFLDGNISEAELTAGNRYAEDMARYYRLVGISAPSPRAQSLFSIAAHDGEVSEGRAKQARAASDHMMKLEGALLKIKDGPQVKTTVFNVCVMDIDHLREMPAAMWNFLHRGLRELVFFYGLQDEGKSAYNKTT